MEGKAMDDGLLVEHRDEITILTINRPFARNALDDTTARALGRALADFDDDDSRKVAIVTGTGGAFCAGADLKALSSDYVAWAGDADGPCAAHLSKPVIAAVEGHAVAGGLGVALRCDIRIASETAVFGVFCRRFGVPMSDGTTVRLPRIVGQGRALHMLLTGEAVDAHTAHDWGLATEVVPEGMALNAALSMAEKLARFPQIAMQSDRLSALQQWDHDSLSAAFANEKHLAEQAKRQEATDGAARFAEGAGRHGGAT
ncbi:crotonase/enoyl-CoA hydratase family protein [Minwuia sp.]|uniref:crotonase/enoyl-CoA hydratase family protein n=1 Tax=Minwuia sp. TaxID=2493630 RepID=UPI003A92E9FF